MKKIVFLKIQKVPFYEDKKFIIFFTQF